MLEGEHERFLGYTGEGRVIAGERAPPPTRAARVDDLGTETVFAVAAEAAALAAQGRTVYPFHLGDLNLATPANIAEAATRRPARRQDDLLPQRRHRRAARGDRRTTSAPPAASTTPSRT